MSECTMPYACNRAVEEITLANESVLLAILSAILLLTFRKSKVHSFTFYLLIALEVVVIANMTRSILTYLWIDKRNVALEDDLPSG